MKAKRPTAPKKKAPAPQQTALTTEQARESLAACLMVLDGAEQSKILQLVERIQVGKQILRGIVSGQLVLGSPAKPPGAAGVTPPVKKS